MEEKDKIKILKEAEQAIKMCKVISNKSFKDFNRYWIRQDKAFQKYSQCYCFSNEILKEYYNRITKRTSDNRANPLKADTTAKTSAKE